MKLTINALLTNPKLNRWKAHTMLGSLPVAGYGGSEKSAISQLRALVARQARFLEKEGYLADLTCRHQLAFEPVPLGELEIIINTHYTDA